MKRFVLALLALFLCPNVWAATCKISEYVDVEDDRTPVAQEPAAVTQTVTYTTAASSSAFHANVKFIRIVCDAKAHFVFGGGTATANSPYFPADTPEYLAVEPGDSVSLYDGSS